MADDSPERIHQQLDGFAKAESKGGEVKVSRLEHVHLSPVSSADSLGFQLIKRAAMETLRGPEVLSSHQNMRNILDCESSKHICQLNNTHVESSDSQCLQQDTSPKAV